MANTDGRDGRAYVGHRVVNGEAGGDRAARRVDVKCDCFLWGIGFEEEELRDDSGGERIIYFAVQADDAFLKCQKWTRGWKAKRT